MHASPSKQRGAALVVGLILLSVLTLLAISGMNTASTELVMAGNEQFRERAFQAAETGIETKVRTLRDVPPDSTPVTLTTTLSDASVTTVVTPRSSGSVQGYGKDYVGYHYDVLSTGLSARNASTVQMAGAYYVNQLGKDGEQRPLDPINQPKLTFP